MQENLEAVENAHGEAGESNLTAERESDNQTGSSGLRKRTAKSAMPLTSQHPQGFEDAGVSLTAAEGLRALQLESGRSKASGSLAEHATPQFGASPCQPENMGVIVARGLKQTRRLVEREVLDRKTVDLIVSMIQIVVQVRVSYSLA